MARRDWAALSQGQRQRYERFGRTQGWDVSRTRSYYESGGSMAAARGHAATPERPERALASPGKYREYVREHTRLGSGGKEIAMVSTDGPAWIRAYRTDRSRIARHWNAVHVFLATGDDRRLRRWEGKTIRDNRTGATLTFETRLDALEDMAPDLATYESIYPSVSPVLGAA